MSDKKSILKEIKDLLFSVDADVNEEKFVDAKTGDLIVRVEGDEFEEGLVISVVTEDGLIPAPAGEHTLDDGRVITVEENEEGQSIIANIEDADDAIEDEVEEEVEDLQKEEEEELGEEPKEELEEEKKKYEEDIKKMEEKIKKMEEDIEKMKEEKEKSEDFSKVVLSKLNDLIEDTPAEKEFKSVKNEYKSLVKEKKNSIDERLESIRRIRRK